MSGDLRILRVKQTASNSSKVWPQLTRRCSMVFSTGQVGSAFPPFFGWRSPSQSVKRHPPGCGRRGPMVRVLCFSGHILQTLPLSKFSRVGDFAEHVAALLNAPNCSLVGKSGVKFQEHLPIEESGLEWGRWGDSSRWNLRSLVADAGTPGCRWNFVLGQSGRVARRRPPNRTEPVGMCLQQLQHRRRRHAMFGVAGPTSASPTDVLRRWPQLLYPEPGHPGDPWRCPGAGLSGSKRWFQGGQGVLSGDVDDHPGGAPNWSQPTGFGAPARRLATRGGAQTHHQRQESFTAWDMFATGACAICLTVSKWKHDKAC